MTSYLYATICEIGTNAERDPEELAAMEISREEWELIAECLEAAGFSSSREGRLAHVRATRLARDIREDILAYLPEAVPA